MLVIESLQQSPDATEDQTLPTYHGTMGTSSTLDERRRSLGGFGHGTVAYKLLHYVSGKIVNERTEER